MLLVFPHQLFKENPALQDGDAVCLVEEYLFFSQYRFHKQKLVLHRASMKFYADFLKGKGHQVEYIEAQKSESDVRKLIPYLKDQGVEKLHCCKVTDYWLEKRLRKTAGETGIEIQWHESPLFLNKEEGDLGYFEGKKSYFQAKFYKEQRIAKAILIEGNDQPTGGQWSFDEDNRQKWPKGKTPPMVEFPKENKYHKEAKEYVAEYFKDNYGDLESPFIYPTTFEESEAWLRAFFKTRFEEFGPYEDALVRSETILNHSVLTPMLNVGLLTPKQILDAALEYAEKHDVPLNSLEGFVRQIIGWREFIRGVYHFKGREERTCNYWKSDRKIPESFWTGETGILPVDNVIRKVLKTGYCHHIERLMVLGNFMLLCEFDPDEVYRWFMELFIDAYDWVMVPNVYGMSQFADGGLMATKPYISGSNYLKKMSDYPNGGWQKIWDGLFWRFMDKHRDFFLKNYRMSMLVRSFDKMDEAKRTGHLAAAEAFLKEV